MKININTIILCVGILLIVGIVWYTRSDNSHFSNSEEYQKIDSVLNVIQERQIRDSIRNAKADSLLLLYSENTKAIQGFANELKKINKQLDQTITDINNLNANELILFYAGQLPKTSDK